MKSGAQQLCGPGQWAAIVAGLDPAMCEEILQRCQALVPVAPEVVGQESAPRHRVGSTRLVPRSGFADIYRLLLDMGSRLNQSYFQLDLTDIVKPPQFVEYFGGNGHFHWHNDYGLERPISNRKLTISVQLSDTGDYRGGDLTVFGTSEPMPRARGSIIALPAYVEHRVTPVTDGVRAALVAWIAGPPLR